MKTANTHYIKNLLIHNYYILTLIPDKMPNITFTCRLIYSWSSEREHKNQLRKQKVKINLQSTILKWTNKLCTISLHGKDLIFNADKESWLPCTKSSNESRWDNPNLYTLAHRCPTKMARMKDSNLHDPSKKVLPH